MSRRYKRNIAQLCPDIRRGLALGLKLSAQEIVLEFKQIGPFWTGDFEKAWIVNKGWDNEVITDLKGEPYGEMTAPKYEDGNGDPSGRKDLTDFFVEPLNQETIEGYNIGNRMEYRRVAMDLVPVNDVWRFDHANATAEPRWFEKYINNGGMDKALKVNIRLGFASVASNPSVRSSSLQQYAADIQS